MYKLVDSASFFSEKESQVTIINFDNATELTKQAADDQITNFVSTIKPQQGKIYLHINAMGAGEFWSANKNGDWFPEENLKAHYKTFETSPAHVFRHHINKDPAKAIGKVIFAIYNERMHRVELIAEVDSQLGSDIEDKLSMGDYPLTSMACKTPYDICSVCGNKAHTRQEYCVHLQTGLGQMMPDGRKIMALNVGPLKFFDISIVIKPADVTSGVLQKVAGEEVVGSAEMAEVEGIGEVKAASHRKLADIIKEISGEVDAASSELSKILDHTKDPDPKSISQLKFFEFSDILAVLAELGISPSLEFLSELIARKTLGDRGRGLGRLAADYIKNVDPSTVQVPVVHFQKPSRFNILAAKLLSPYLEDSSLLPEYVEKRATIGYASFNANGYIEHPVQEEKKPAPDHSFAKTLLTIGGVALLAKMYISHLIQERLKNRLVNSDNFNAKIVIVKQASDYLTAFKLAKCATAKEMSEREKERLKKNLEQVASGTKLILKSTQTQVGGKLSKAIKSVELGSKLVDKYSKGN